MPYPKAGEDKSAYVARFMASAEAQKDYPDQKQRTAVAYAMWDKRENRNAKDWAASYSALHLEPGLVKYQDLGPIDNATGRPKGMVLLLKKEAIDLMRPTFEGKPVYNEAHQDADPSHFEQGKAHGIVSGTEWDGEKGWDIVHMLIWDDATKENIESGRYGVSCAYIPTEVDETPGVYHNIPYDGEIKNGYYTHLAVVDNPRYEGARIIVNSAGGDNMRLWFMPKGKKEQVELDKTTEVEVDGKKLTLGALVNALKAEEAHAAQLSMPKPNEAPEGDGDVLGDDSVVKVDDKDVKMADLKNAYRAHLTRLNAEAEAQKMKEADAQKAKLEEEKANADKAEKEKADKAEKEEQAAKEKAEKEALANAAATEEHRRKFIALKNASQRRGEIVEVKRLNAADKEKLGSDRYGSKK